MPTITSIRRKTASPKQTWSAKGDPFYQSKEWRDLRRQKITENALCEDCYAAGRATTATDVHHVLSRKQRPDLELEISNLRSLCKGCHQKITAGDGGKRKRK